jgi:hypothetical protein
LTDSAKRALATHTAHISSVLPDYGFMPFFYMNFTMPCKEKEIPRKYSDLLKELLINKTKNFTVVQNISYLAVYQIP